MGQGEGERGDVTAAGRGEGDGPVEGGGGPAEGLPFPASLCHRCAETRYVRTKRSVFVLCTALEEKYPPQPVARCPRFRPRS